MVWGNLGFDQRPTIRGSQIWTVDLNHSGFSWLSPAPGSAENNNIVSTIIPCLCQNEARGRGDLSREPRIT